ncbi:MAG: DUF1835 domain-containing protein [Cyclobacteriaceae bacterium]|nr:DUF1835 domain-containing protein [Cyclobacteriaceae bacterium]
MVKRFHILNGDALKEQFPDKLEGEKIVARECLMDGNVKAENLDKFYKVRARFIMELSNEFTESDYYNLTVQEFEKIRKIPEGSEIFLWFEDDLFCQVNFWFVVYLIVCSAKNSTIFLIRPQTHTQYGFGGLSEAELLQAFKERVKLTETEKIAGLWESYQNDDTISLSSTAHQLRETYPFILDSVEAHKARIPTENDPGRPVRSLIEVMNELRTEEFAPVFKEFSKREKIYGYGDLQVKRLLENIKNNRLN